MQDRIRLVCWPIFRQRIKDTYWFSMIWKQRTIFQIHFLDNDISPMFVMTFIANIIVSKQRITRAVHIWTIKLTLMLLNRKWIEQKWCKFHAVVELMACEEYVCNSARYPLNQSADWRLRFPILKVLLRWTRAFYRTL